MILVDTLREYETKLRHKTWCHMVSDTSEEELHAFAAKLGLRREWAQLRPKASAAHYDLTPSKRSLALRLGAVAVTGRELCARNYDGLRRRGLLRDVSLPTEHPPWWCSRCGDECICRDVDDTPPPFEVPL